MKSIINAFILCLGTFFMSLAFVITWAEGSDAGAMPTVLFLCGGILAVGSAFVQEELINKERK